MITDSFLRRRTARRRLASPFCRRYPLNDLSGVKADPDGERTINLLEAVNGIFKDTPFVLAHRALNEALLSVVCFNPSDDAQLQAVWDDFLMMKLLPRICPWFFPVTWS